MIETERLRLRRHRLEDFEDLAAMWADPKVTRFVGGKPLSTEESWARLLRYSGHWDLLDFGYWAVVDKATGSYIGDVGFADWKRDMEPSTQGFPELGWVFASRAHGQGYATEAVRGALTWGAANLASPRVICLINGENTASIRVAVKCGFREYGCANYHQRAMLLFEHVGVFSS